MKIDSLITALVPLKNLAHAKSRLDPVLEPKVRSALALCLADHVLRILTNSRVVREIYVVGSDNTNRELAASYNAKWVIDRDKSLNEAVDAAVAGLNQFGRKLLLVIPADLPMLTSKDVESMWSASREGAVPVLVEAANDKGTNAILMDAQDWIGACYGPKSIEKHADALKVKGLNVNFVQRPGIQFDLDTPKDLEKLKSIRKSLDLELDKWLEYLESKRGSSGGLP